MHLKYSYKYTHVETKKGGVGGMKGKKRKKKFVIFLSVSDYFK